MEGIQHNTINVNGLNIHIAEKGTGPLVLFLHGFPELWYSWRHQILYLADQGYQAVAPDLRGYGQTTGAPINDHTKFTILHLVGDLIGLLDAITNEGEKIFVVGHHDWGAIIAWYFCMFRPDRVIALVNLSVTFAPWNPNGDVVELLRLVHGDDHYMTRFQKPGEIEAEFGKMSYQTFIKKFLTLRDPGPLLFPKGKGFIHSPPDVPVILPPWLSEQDIRLLRYPTRKRRNYGWTQLLSSSSFFGYLIYDRNWELNSAWRGAKVMVPTKFVVGDMDLTYHMPGVKDYMDSGGFKKDVPLLEEVVVMKGVAHFINQEKPDEINKHIIDFIKKF